MSYDFVKWGRLPDPTTTPAGPGFTSIDLTVVDPGMVHPLNNGGTVSVRYPSGSYWTIDITYPELDIAQARSIQPFLYSLQGGFTDFYISLPTYSNPQSGVWDVSLSAYEADDRLSVSPDASNRLLIANWSAVTPSGNDITAGDMLKISNSRKIYYVTSTSLAGDVLSVNLNCDILDKGSLIGAKLEMNDILFKVRTVKAIPPFKLGSNGLYSSFSLSLRENIL